MGSIAENIPEDEWIMLSGIQHFAYCRRQWALIHIDCVWSENLRTIEGQILHERAHDGDISEKRGNIITVRALPIHSAELGISGECDVVEFTRDDKNGVPLDGRAGKYTVLPVEYKRGKPKDDALHGDSDMDALQLCAQAICLSEMLCCDIDRGCLYYGELRRRVTVKFTSELREKVCSMFHDMRDYYYRRYIPRVKRTRSCSACSIKDICLPSLGGKMDAKRYIEENFGGTV
ncbi:MAG: CRISPR-associated protein Cas4 [Eubacteriales bacterium]